MDKTTSTDLGRVQVYTGDGKGKTTAAVGLAVRACGAGLRVFFGQFIKGGDSSELEFFRMRCPEVHCEHFGRGRFVRGKPAAEDLGLARLGLDRLRAAVASGSYDLVIADEANGAVKAGLFAVGELLSLIPARAAHVELVFTGRDAHPDLVAMADLVTEMRCVKHYFGQGIAARKGIER